MSVVFFVNWSGLVGLGFRVIGGGWGGAARIPFSDIGGWMRPNLEGESNFK